MGLDLIGRDLIGRDRIGRDFIAARLDFLARRIIRLTVLSCFTLRLACLVEVFAPSFLSLRLIRLRRFFIDIASFSVNFLTRRLRLRFAGVSS